MYEYMTVSVVTVLAEALYWSLAPLLNEGWLHPLFIMHDGFSEIGSWSLFVRSSDFQKFVIIHVKHAHIQTLVFSSLNMTTASEFGDNIPVWSFVVTIYAGNLQQNPVIKGII